MTKIQRFTFEEIVKQNENRIYYQLHRLGIQDYDGEFYTEGLYAMWIAYKNYDTNKGPMATYFNFAIRNRIIDLIRKKVTTKENEASYIQEAQTDETLTSNMEYRDPIKSAEEKIANTALWEKVFATLTEKQKKWVYYAIIKELTHKEIAEKEGVTVEAVKGWAKEAKIKLRRLWEEEEELVRAIRE